MNDYQWVQTYNMGDGDPHSMIHRIQEAVIMLLSTNPEINRNIEEGCVFTASYDNKFPIKIDATQPNKTAVLTIWGEIALRLERRAAEQLSSVFE